MTMMTTSIRWMTRETNNDDDLDKDDADGDDDDAVEMTATF